MSTELTSDQKACFERFVKLRVGALFMKMGTGKTRIALEIVRYNDPEFLLYLTPVSTIENIRREFDKWGVECPFSIVGYESIAASDRIYIETRDTIKQYERVFIIADESIFIKNGRAKRFRRALDLRQHCQWALILNGTPIVREERDIYFQMQFLSPKIINMNYFEFLDTFFVKHLIRRGLREVCYHTFYEPNRPAFLKLIAPYVFSADLFFEHRESSETRWINHRASLIEYEHGKAAIMASIDARGLRDMATIIDLFEKLHALAAMADGKNQAVAEYIRGKKLLCFCWLREEVADLAERCDCFVITGDTPQIERQRILDDFAACEGKPLVMTLGVGSYSLNMQFVSEIVYSSLVWNYGNLEQSRYRIKRIGQENDIKYTTFLLDVGINHMIVDNLDTKTTLADIVKREIERGDTEKTLGNL